MTFKQFIHKLRAERSAKRQFDNFLRTKCNMALKDNINNLPRPKKSVLRILCTSDSMHQQLKSLGSDADYMVVNSFVMDEAYKKVSPRYYVIADPNFFGTLHTVVEKIYADTAWPMILFVPQENASKYEVFRNENIRVLPVNTTPYAGATRYRDICYDHNLAAPPIYNVLNMALYVAIYLGYKNVELYGVEHSWTKFITVGEDNKLYRFDSHFYDKEKVEKTVYQRAVDGSYIKMHEILEEYAALFRTYWEIQELAKRKDCRIINCTQGSYIDAFERKSVVL